MANGSDRVSEIRTSAHLMTLEPGLYCAHTGGGAQPVDPATHLPDVRVTRAPGVTGENVTLAGLHGDGLVGDGAVLIRVAGAPAPVLITIYQRQGATEPAPNLQIQRIDGVPAEPARAPAGRQAAAAARAPEPKPGGRAEVAAHIQRRGDVTAPLSRWIGEPGSQRWIEGFALAPDGIAPADIEYQAVLGRGWLSPWVKGGDYCGSRGMALPILGLRVRLKGALAAEREVSVEASFTDGSRRGPVGGDATCEAETLAPLEAFRVVLQPRGAGAGPDATPKVAPEAGRGSAGRGKPAGRAAEPGREPVAPRSVPARGKGRAAPVPVPSPAAKRGRRG